MKVADKLMGLVTIILCEVTQTQKDRCRDFFNLLALNLQIYVVHLEDLSRSGN